jgi:hypothetical protein
MTIHERIIYGKLANAVSLRQEIATRAARTFQTAQRLRMLVVIAATVVGLMQIAAFADILPVSQWVNSHAYQLTLSVVAATLFASAHVWCCRQRLDESEDNLAGYLKGLPVTSLADVHKGVP